METIAVVGLGYVGLPLAVAFGRKRQTIGFDLDEQKLVNYRQRLDPGGEVEAEEFASSVHLSFTTDPADLASANIIVVAVPTPIDDAHRPDLRALEAACRTIGANLSPDSIVVFESTVYPGCTEEVCVPILEEVSGMLWAGNPTVKSSDKKPGFHIGYSPERINPGDK